MQGTILANRYLLLEELGSGGMGRVCRAADLRTGGTVAIKLLHPWLTRDAAYVARLRREAQIAASLASPRVVRVTDLDTHEGAPFLVMEWVPGETLAGLLDARGRLPVVEAVALCLEVARALEAAHAAGIVHRDLKPDNIKLVDGQVKVLDFGIAHASAVGASVTVTGQYIGTPTYSAPERVSGEGDIRSDIYAVGVILFELVEGYPPFDGPSPFAVLRHHQTTPPPPLHAGAPPVVQAIVSRCMDKDPAARFQTPTELAQALRDAGDSLTGAATLNARSGEQAQPRDVRPPSSTATAALPEARITQARTQTLASSPVASSAPAPPNNLPVPLTSFVGRDRETGEILELLEGTHLLTLTGSGGVGKTRLAVEAARRVLTRYLDGAWVVELAPLVDPTLVPQAVATVLGVREQHERPLMATLVDYLKPRRTLLVLDNCEHLVAACAALAEALLSACPDLAILATSREALVIPGETLFRVPSLAAPDPRRALATGAGGDSDPAEYDAVRLFADRAAAVRPGFVVTPENGAAVTRVCWRLDGIPLALELAAARLKALTVEQIAARLDDRFRLLTGGSRTALPRQQTLRALIDWSYDLLAEDERRLFERLSVFAGGFTLEAAEAVCDDREEGSGKREEAGLPPPSLIPLPAADVLDLLSHLVDKSLAIPEGDADGARYRLLETLREYGQEKLAAAGGQAGLRLRHLTWCLALAEEAEPELRGPRQQAWLDRLELEHDNLRTALITAVETGEADAGLRIGGALWRFWWVRGYLSEGRHWLEQVIASGMGSTRARAKVLHGQGVLAWSQGESAQARILYQQSLAIYRDAGDTQQVAWLLTMLGQLAGDQADYTAARTYFEESLVAFRKTGDVRGAAASLSNLGLVADYLGDYPAARPRFEESLGLFRTLGDNQAIANQLNNLGHVAAALGDYEAARPLYEESLALRRELQDRSGIARSLYNLGTIACHTGDLITARRLHEEGLAIRRQIGDRGGVSWSLNGLGQVAYEEGDWQRARALLEEGLAAGREAANRPAVAALLASLGRTAQRQGDLDRAVKLHGEALAVRREMQDTLDIASSLLDLGRTMRLAGAPERAASLLGEALALYRAARVSRGIALCLAEIAALRMRDQPGDAARLLAAAAAVRDAAGISPARSEHADEEQLLDQVRLSLGQNAFAAAWGEGHAMDVDMALATAASA